MVLSIPKGTTQFKGHTNRLITVSWLDISYDVRIYIPGDGTVILICCNIIVHVYDHTDWYNGWYRWATIIHDTKNAIFQWFEEVYDCVCQTPNHYEFLSIYRQANGRYIDMKTDLDMPPLIFTIQMYIYCQHSETM